MTAASSHPHRPSRPRQVTPTAATLLLHKPVTTWYAEWKAAKASQAAAAPTPAPAGENSAALAR